MDSNVPAFTKEGQQIEAIRRMILTIGDDPFRAGLHNTPVRVIDSWKELFAGYKLDPKEILYRQFDAVFGRSGTYDEMIVVKNVEFVSFCEHHLLPFTGVAHVGYLPSDKVVGLSKLARLVDVYAKRLQIQERMTVQITTAVMEHLNPRGAGCVVEATHACLSCRGARKQNASMITSSLLGAFREVEKTKSEFLQFVRTA